MSNNTETKAKRQLSQEQLERLKVAREKALAVRQEKANKINEIKRLEKEAKEKELNDKLAEMKSKVEQPALQVEEKVIVPTPKPRHSRPSGSKPKKKADEVIKQIVEEDSSESSGSESDDDDDVTEPVKALYKNKYKQKYKNKYQAKSISTLTKGVAVQSIRKKVDDEIARIAQLNLFGY